MDPTRDALLEDATTLIDDARSRYERQIVRDHLIEASAAIRVLRATSKAPHFDRVVRVTAQRDDLGHLSVLPFVVSCGPGDRRSFEVFPSEPGEVLGIRAFNRPGQIIVEHFTFRDTGANDKRCPYDWADFAADLTQEDRLALQENPQALAQRHFPATEPRPIGRTHPATVTFRNPENEVYAGMAGFFVVRHPEPRDPKTLAGEWQAGGLDQYLRHIGWYPC